MIIIINNNVNVEEMTRWRTHTNNHLTVRSFWWLCYLVKCGHTVNQTNFATACLVVARPALQFTNTLLHTAISRGKVIQINTKIQRTWYNTKHSTSSRQRVRNSHRVSETCTVHRCSSSVAARCLHLAPTHFHTAICNKTKLCLKKGHHPTANDNFNNTCSILVEH